MKIDAPPEHLWMESSPLPKMSCPIQMRIANDDGEDQFLPRQWCRGGPERLCRHDYDSLCAAERLLLMHRRSRIENYETEALSCGSSSLNQSFHTSPITRRPSCIIHFIVSPGRDEGRVWTRTKTFEKLNSNPRFGGKLLKS